MRPIGRRGGGEIMHGYIGIGIDNDLQSHPKKHASRGEKCIGEYQPHCTKN
jgi:hypothetical protein